MKIVIAGTGTTRKGFIAEERCGECSDEAIQTGPMALHILYFQKVQK